MFTCCCGDGSPFLCPSVPLVVSSALSLGGEASLHQGFSGGAVVAALAPLSILCGPEPSWPRGSDMEVSAYLQSVVEGQPALLLYSGHGMASKTVGV